MLIDSQLYEIISIIKTELRIIDARLYSLSNRFERGCSFCWLPRIALVSGTDQVVNPDFIGTLPTELQSNAGLLFCFSRILTASLVSWLLIDFRTSPNRSISRDPESVLSFWNRCIQDRYAGRVSPVNR
jgi:hypothetical protein